MASGNRIILEHEGGQKIAHVLNALCTQGKETVCGISVSDFGTFEIKEGTRALITCEDCKRIVNFHKGVQL